MTVEEIRNMSMEEREAKNNKLLKEFSILEEKISIKEQSHNIDENSMLQLELIRLRAVEKLKKERNEVWANIKLLGDNFGI